MAVIRMNTELGKFRYSDGYHDCKITYYVYCSKCGSFNIKEYKSLKTWAGVAFGLFLAILAGVALWNLVVFNAPVWMGGIGCFLVTFIGIDLMITFAIYDRENKYRCRKCGNRDVAEENPFNYQEEDRSVIDVPDRLTCRFYEYTYA